MEVLLIPEYSEGGACNYGSTGIKYYAAINVNQIPGDLKGQWQGGQICGRCARVRVTTKMVKSVLPLSE